MSNIKPVVLFAALATIASAQYGPPSGNGGSSYGNSGSSGDGGSSSSGSSGSSNYGGNSNPFAPGGSIWEMIISKYTVTVTAHAVLATLAFGFLFPVGSIMIRVASFPGLWWVHGVFQMVAYVLYIAAVAIGIMLATRMNRLGDAHPVIGLTLFALLMFQPILGFLHHAMFKKYSRRTVWSYGHIWLGRIAVTLGIINGGLGLQFAQRGPFRADKSHIIGYSVAAGTMWLIYVASAIFGEVKRKRTTTAAADNKGEISPLTQYDENKENHRAQYA